MARKRKKLKGIDYESSEYWNRLLNQDGLSLNAGKTEKLIYAGGSIDIDRLKGFLDTRIGRVAPHDTGDGAGDDKE
jgi:hypothetical protein